MNTPQSMGPGCDAMHGSGSAQERRKADDAGSAEGAGARRRRTLRSALARRIQSVSQKPLAVRSRKMKSEVGSATGSAARRTSHQPCASHTAHACNNSCLRTLGHAAVGHQRAPGRERARNLRRRCPAHAVQACGAHRRFSTRPHHRIAPVPRACAQRTQLGRRQRAQRGGSGDVAPRRVRPKHQRRPERAQLSGSRLKIGPAT